MYNPESVPESEMLKLIWDFKIQTDHLIPARQPDQVIVKKRKKEKRKKKGNLPNCRLCCSGRLQSKIERKQGLVSGTCYGNKKKQTMEHESDSDTHCNWRTRYSHKRIGWGTGGLGNKRMSRDHPKNSFINIGQNTKTYPGDLREFTVNQAQVRSHRLALLWRTLQREKK